MDLSDYQVGWRWGSVGLSVDLRVYMIEKLKPIKLIAMDVDGVLTDGSIIMSAEGDIKIYSVMDGLGISLAIAAGVSIVWITGNISPAIERRAAALRITELYQGARYKSVALRKVAEDRGLELEEIAFIGDDLNDLPAFELAGISFAVANAADEVKAAADIITKRSGGKGAVREVIETVLNAQGRWESGVQAFLNRLREEEEQRVKVGDVN